MAVIRIGVGHISVQLIRERDRVVGHILAGHGFEPHTLARWARWCRLTPRCIVLDIGGYSGLFGIAAERAGHHAIIIEPMPLQVERIRENAALNGVHPEVLQAAATEHSGHGEVVFNPKVLATAGASLERHSGTRQPVQLLRVDDRHWDHVGLVKIDVERHEPAVLRGMRETIQRCRPLMIVESLDEAHKHAVLHEVADYVLLDVLDTRNLVLVPRERAHDVDL